MPANWMGQLTQDPPGMARDATHIDPRVQPEPYQDKIRANDSQAWEPVAAMQNFLAQKFRPSTIRSESSAMRLAKGVRKVVGDPYENIGGPGGMLLAAPSRSLMAKEMAELAAKDAARIARVRVGGHELAKYNEIKIADKLNELKRIDPAGRRYKGEWDQIAKDVRYASQEVVASGEPYRFTRTGPRTDIPLDRRKPRSTK